VQRLHHGHAGAFGGADHRGAEQQQRVVNVHSIDVLCFYNVFYIPGSSVVPHGMQGQQSLGQTVGGFLVAALIHDDLMAAAFQQGALGRKDGILTARQPIMAVHQQNFHRGRPPFVHIFRPNG